MKLLMTVLLCLGLLIISPALHSQCSICTKTAQQLGEKPAKGLNAGILYLALTPIILASFIGYRWWKKNRHS